MATTDKDSTVTLTDKDVIHALSILSKLRSASAKSMQDAGDKLARIRGVDVRDGLVTVTFAGLFGSDVDVPPGAAEVRFCYRIADAEAEEKTPDDDDFSSDGPDESGDASDSASSESATSEDGSDAEEASKGVAEASKKYNTPLARARSVFQSRPVVETLIAVAGPQLDQVNMALNDALVAKKAASKRRRVELHAMPGPDDTPASARRKLSLVAQQAIGAVWTLARAGVPGSRDEVENAMQTLSAKLTEDAHALFTLPETRNVFAKFVGSDSTGALRACTTCHTMGCRNCRKNFEGAPE